jgi:hypothetical protein
MVDHAGYEQPAAPGLAGARDGYHWLMKIILVLIVLAVLVWLAMTLLRGRRGRV